MAELIRTCCPPDTLATCCQPTAKASCCGDHDLEGCGCAAGAAPGSSSGRVEPAIDRVRESVREKYAALAVATGSSDAEAGCCSAGGNDVFGATLYSASGEHGAAGAANASLGCGVPTAVADLATGEVVLDLGSGAGADVLISAQRVGPNGKAIGIDMTDEMLELARRHAAEAGIANAAFMKGYIEDLPLPDASVDVVLSNCAINLSGDKRTVLAEAARVLKPGGRLAISDVITDADIDEATRAEIGAWTGCIAGALTESEFRAAAAAAGLQDIEIRETHRVHAHAAAAIIRAVKPLSA